MNSIISSLIIIYLLNKSLDYLSNSEVINLLHKFASDITFLILLCLAIISQNHGVLSLILFEASSFLFSYTLQKYMKLLFDKRQSYIKP